MTGSTGPYENEDGDIWVPRTVPYLEARRIAKSGGYEGDTYERLEYVGKADPTLFGFTRACDCDWDCTDARDVEDGGKGLDDACVVPAWHFRRVER